MSKISSYGIVSPPVAGDLVIGTNTIDSNKTKNFRVEDIAALAVAPTLSEVLTAGNTASNNISLIGSLSITGNSSLNGINTFGPSGTSDFNHSVAFDAITLGSTVQDGAGSVGTAGQVLSSTGSGVAWVNNKELNVLSVASAIDQELVAANTRKQVDFGAAVSSAYFSLASDGTITAITAGTYSISINLNSGSLLVGLGDAHVDFFYAVDLNDSQIQTTYQNTVFFDAQSSDPAQTLTIQFLQTVAVGDTLKVYQAASVYTASGSNSMQSGLVSKSTGTTGMGVVPSAAIYIHKV